MAEAPEGSEGGVIDLLRLGLRGLAREPVLHDRVDLREALRLRVLRADAVPVAGDRGGPRAVADLLGDLLGQVPERAPDLRLATLDLLEGLADQQRPVDRGELAEGPYVMPGGAPGEEQLLDDVPAQVRRVDSGNQGRLGRRRRSPLLLPGRGWDGRGGKGRGHMRSRCVAHRA